jgi:predicted amidohydrolase
VVAAAQSGRHNAKRKSYGHSLVVDPWGAVVVDAGGIDSDDEGEQEKDRGDPVVVCCDVDLDLVDAIRQRMPVQLHREQADWK